MDGVKLVMRGRLLAAVGMAALVGCGAAFAQTPPEGAVDTLREALVKTYDTNPTIMAERRRTRPRYRRSAARRTISSRDLACGP